MSRLSVQQTKLNTEEAVRKLLREMKKVSKYPEPPKGVNVFEWIRATASEMRRNER